MLLDGQAELAWRAGYIAIYLLAETFRHVTSVFLIGVTLLLETVQNQAR